MASDKRLCDLQKFCCTVEKAVSVPGEDNCRELDRQLEVMQSFSEVAPSYPSEVSDSISTLVKILANPCTPSTVCRSIMTALRIQSKWDAGRDVMITQYNVLLPLSLILSKEQEGKECLKLLQQLTYGIRTTCPNGYIEDIVRFVVNKIISQVQGTMLEYLDVLANLCQRNVTVQAFVKGLPAIHTLQRKLLSNLSDANVSLVILSLHILASLFMTEELGTRIFSSSNMEQSFQLAFSVLFAYGTNTAGAIYAADLLVGLLSYQRMQAVFKQYGQLQDCLHKAVSLLPRVEGVVLAKMAELCVVFCRVPGLRAAMVKLLLQRRTSVFPLGSLLAGVTVPSVASSKLTLSALDLLKEVIEEVFTGCESVEQIELTLVQITSTCQLPDYTKGDYVISTCLAQLSKLLSIWSDILHTSVHIDVCSTIVHIDVCCTIVHKSVSEHVGTKIDFLVALIQDLIRNNRTCSTEKPWITEVMMQCLDVLLKLSQHSQSARASLHSLLKEQQLLPIIGHSLQSTNKVMIIVVLQLLVEAQTAEGFDIGRLAQALVVINDRQKMEAVERSTLCTDAECSDKVLMREKVVVDTAAVDDLIQKFKNGLELKDIKTSEIIDVYEHKLQAMQQKECHLQDLVDAKSLALTQADRLISQYRGRKAHIDEECLKLRTLLQGAERHSEGLTEKVEELQKHAIQQTKEIDNLKSQNIDLLHIADEHKKLLAAFQEQSSKLEGTQQKLVSKEEHVKQLCSQMKLLQSNYEAVNIQNQRLNEQLQDTCGQLQQLQEQYHHCEDKCERLQNVLTEQQRKYKSLEDVKEALDENIGSLNTKLRLTEQQIQLLNQECAAQRDEASVLKRHITRLQAEVQELREVNMKLQEEVNLFSAVKSLILNKS
ncbi:hypothetical protein EMCRGX_G031971 [Ephydatia muelleri]